MEILAAQRAQKRMSLHAFVIMPDHVHLLLTPAPEVSLEKAMQFIKGGFSFQLKSKMDVWERSYDSRRIQDRAAFDACQRYIHQNPVEAYKVMEAEFYPYSSAAPGTSVDPVPEHFIG